MKPIKHGTVDVSVVIRIVDSADGTPETGVTSATGGLDLKYRREGAAAVNLTESDLSALTDAHSDGGMLHIGAGYYRVDIPDAAFASGVNGVLIFGTVTGMVVIGCYVPLVAYDPQDAVRAGLTLFTGITSLAEWLGLIAGKQTGNSTARTELRATGAGSGTFDETTDSQEAIRDTAPLGTAMRGTDNALLASSYTTPPTAVQNRQEMDSNSTKLAAAALEATAQSVKTKTDQLTFTITNKVDATIQAAADFAQAAADKVWSSATRTLTTNFAVKKNTALANFEFLMVLTSDHVTGATGKTVTATRSLDGAAFAACANSVTEVSNGIYKISLAAGDLNGDTVTLKFTAADCDATFVEIITQP